MKTLNAAVHSGPRSTVGRLLALLISVLAALAVGGVLATPASAQLISNKCTYTNSQPTLQRGSSGTAVRQVQCELNYSMDNVEIAQDGSFGATTDSTVRRFQRCLGLPVDGIVGPNTWRQLNLWAWTGGLNC
ncbi:peptidoglycan-binding protein [Cryptosporangium sp. NPDC051539]|uniref:peptidoglycan-binding protein n=1 Tax=Cryptosporangium sp. NPDC051539 TaxID=3363962 RepID=UPI0037AC1852